MTKNHLVLCGVKVEPAIVKLLDRAVDLEGQPSRSALLRHIIDRYLNGCLPPPQQPQGDASPSMDEKGLHRAGF